MVTIGQKVNAILAILVVLFLPADPVPSYQVHLPLVVNPLGRRGIAWGYYRNLDRDLVTLEASYWTGRFWDPWIDLNSDPIVPVVKFEWWDKGVTHIPSSWRKTLQVMNEPNLSHTAEEAAEFSCLARRQWPAAILWVPNITMGNWASGDQVEGWLADYQAALTCDLAPFQWAIHHYSADRTDFPSDSLDRVCQAISCQKGVIISEYGQTWQDKNMMAIWTRDIHQDPRVLSYAAFTNDDDCDYCTWDMAVRDSGALTPYGQGYVAGGRP